VLSVGPGAWRILEIQEGSEIIDTPGIVSSLCAPLFSQQHVEEMLYLSTFVSDLILVRAKHIDIAEEIVGNNLHFLVESRRKVQEAMAIAEQEEIEAERRRSLMEQEDMRRANEGTEGGGEEEDDRADDPPADESSASFRASLGIPVPSRSDPPLPPSVASSVSSSSDLFHFSLASNTTVSTIPTAATATSANIAANVLASKLPPPTAARASHSESEGRFTRPRSPSHAAPSAGLQQLCRESEGGDEGIAMHLSKLPFRLVLLTFHAQYLPQCTCAILHALLQSSAPSAATTPAHFRPSFFSFTQAGSQVSLIVEASCLPLFPSHIVTQHRSVWAALQVSQGTESTDPAGLVAPLSSVLAKVGVSIYYLSTCNLDYILVAEKEVELALDALQRSMNVIVDS
jgi:hypothetical protein